MARDAGGREPGGGVCGESHVIGREEGSCSEGAGGAAGRHRTPRAGGHPEAGLQTLMDKRWTGWEQGRACLPEGPSVLKAAPTPRGAGRCSWSSAGAWVGLGVGARAGRAQGLLWRRKGIQERLWVMGAWRELGRIITCIDFRLISKQPFYYRNFRKQLNIEKKTRVARLRPHEVTGASVPPVPQTRLPRARRKLAA